MSDDYKYNYWDNISGDDETAGQYMMTYGEGPGFATRSTVESFINDGETVLDVGCGPGWNLDHFMQYGPDIKRYKGIDYSIRFVRAANERANQLYEDLKNPFQLGDARDIKEGDNSWDVVIIQDCLEHTNGYETPTKECLRVAKKRVIVSFWHLTDSDTPHINDDGDDGWGAWYDKREWEKFLDTLGYAWLYYELEPPEGKNHKWDFYVIDKEEPK